MSPELRTFLAQRLSTMEQVEIVLLLRSDRGRSWTATEVAQELRTAPESAAMRLFLLASGGLVVFEPAAQPRYRYTGPVDVAPLIDELAAVHADDRASLAAAVGGGPADPIQSFADAFKLKK